MRTGATVSSTAQQRSLSLLRPSSRALTVEPSSGEMMHVDPYEHLAIGCDVGGISHVAGGFYNILYIYIYILHDIPYARHLPRDFVSTNTLLHLSGLFSKGFERYIHIPLNMFCHAYGRCFVSVSRQLKHQYPQHFIGKGVFWYPELCVSICALH